MIQDVVRLKSKDTVCCDNINVNNEATHLCLKGNSCGLFYSLFHREHHHCDHVPINSAILTDVY